jgi:type VI secretion system protein ImpK
MTTSPPSLLGSPLLHASARQFETEDSTHVSSLLDMMYDGFYALFLLKSNNAPQDSETLLAKMQKFLTGVELSAKKLGISDEDVLAAKYAFCACVDEIVLRSQFSIRDAWERRPLQLVLFGDQLAGENFFNQLEVLRAKGAIHIHALEVFHMCLLMGFQGKYVIEGLEKLNYITARLGDEISHIKGKSAGFAPHWARPDAITNRLRNDAPLWVIGAIFSLMALAAYVAFNWALLRSTQNGINGYTEIVRLAPRAANLTITLP